MTRNFGTPLPLYMKYHDWFSVASLSGMTRLSLMPDLKMTVNTLDLVSFETHKCFHCKWTWLSGCTLRCAIFPLVFVLINSHSFSYELTMTWIKPDILAICLIYYSFQLVRVLKIRRRYLTFFNIVFMFIKVLTVPHN